MWPLSRAVILTQAAVLIFTSFFQKNSAAPFSCKVDESGRPRYGAFSTLACKLVATITIIHMYFTFRFIFLGNADCSSLASSQDAYILDSVGSTINWQEKQVPGYNYTTQNQWNQVCLSDSGQYRVIVGEKPVVHGLYKGSVLVSSDYGASWKPAAKSTSELLIKWGWKSCAISGGTSISSRCT